MDIVSQVDSAIHFSKKNVVTLLSELHFVVSLVNSDFTLVDNRIVDGKQAAGWAEVYCAKTEIFLVQWIIPFEILK